MKMNKRFLTILGIFAAFAVFFMACKDDDVVTPPTVDKTALKTALDAANALYTSAVEGVAVGNYEVGSKAALKTAIDAGQAIYTSTTATAAEAANAAVNLTKATELFTSKKVAEIAPDKLVGFWKFDGDAKDASGNKHDGTVTKGHAFFGAGTPTLTKDRYGVADKAYHFEKGGNIEVPYASSLNPQKEMTIAVWVKMDADTVVWANNYILSMNRWNGYKFQTQSTNRPFFTVHTSDDKYYDRDGEKDIEKGKWYHLAVTSKSGEMAFYINGVQFKVWTNTPGDFITVPNVNLTIGQDLPTSKYTTTKGDFFVNDGGYFKGDIDEVRMYNAVLSSTQITSIYNAEKP